MLELSALSMIPAESNAPLLILPRLIHLSGKEENEFKGRMKVRKRTHKPEGD